MAHPKPVNERVKDLINTSVDDMRSSLGFYKGDDPEDVEVVRLGLKRCVERREKTKAAMLNRWLKKMEKERIRALYLSRLTDAEKEEGV